MSVALHNSTVMRRLMTEPEVDAALQLTQLSGDSDSGRYCSDEESITDAISDEAALDACPLGNGNSDRLSSTYSLSLNFSSASFRITDLQWELPTPCRDLDYYLASNGRWRVADTVGPFCQNRCPKRGFSLPLCPAIAF